MTQETEKIAVTDVPSQVIQRFLERLRASEISDAVVERLAKVLAEHRKPSEVHISDALFREDEFP